MMRICVFGAGAIGGHMAARLAAAGHTVSVVARGANLSAMRERGLTLRTGDRVIRGKVQASDNPADLGPQDAVLVTTKANALSPAATAIAALLARDTPVVFVRNGIPWWYALRLTRGRPTPPDLSKLDPGGALHHSIGEERTVGGVVYSSNEVVEPGVDYDIEADFAPGSLYPPHKPSILQDFERGRPMEVEALLMTPLAFARAAGVPTPNSGHGGGTDCPPSGGQGTLRPINRRAKGYRAGIHFNVSASACLENT